jgi:hypothetical protein
MSQGDEFNLKCSFYMFIAMYVLSARFKNKRGMMCMHVLINQSYT